VNLSGEKEEKELRLKANQWELKPTNENKDSNLAQIKGVRVPL
jgi:hypothetical protein